MWIVIRASLLGIVKAIENHAAGSSLAVPMRAGLLTITNAIECRYNLRNKKIIMPKKDWLFLRKGKKSRTISSIRRGTNNMAQTQIFISHSSADRVFTDKLYDALLADRYWVWMDKSLQPAEEWEPQIDEQLRKSKIFLVLFSSASVKSEWVKHEGSMALALNQQIIPVKIDPSSSDVEKNLPIWARPIQLHKLFDGSADYNDQYQVLKQLLGRPLPIRQYLIQMLRPYQDSGVLLDEVALALIEKHYDQLNLTRAQQLIADELIQESGFRLASYWTRYEKLKKAYDQTRTEYLTLKLENRGLQSDVFLRNFLLFVFATAFLLIFFWSTYYYFQSLF